MNLNQLRYFVAVGEELHFGRAAERLGMAQPPLSQQIRKLEESLGIELFRRTSRKVELTEAGAALFEEARLICERVEAVRQMVQEKAGRFAGSIDIGAVNPALDTFLPALVHEFLSGRKDVRVSLHEKRSGEQIDAVRGRLLDLGFIRRFEHDLSGLKALVVSRENYMLAIPSQHALAKRKAIPLKALQDAPLIMAPRRHRPGLHDRLVSAFHEAGFSPNIVQEAPSKRTEVSLVAAGIGVALVPESYARVFRRQGVAYRPLQGSLPTIEIVAVWNTKNLSAALMEFLDLVRARMSRPSDINPH